MTPVAGVLSDRFGRMAVLLPALYWYYSGRGILCLFATGEDNGDLTCHPGGLVLGRLACSLTHHPCGGYEMKHLPAIMGASYGCFEPRDHRLPRCGDGHGGPVFVFTLALPTAV